MRSGNERGIALVLALFLMTALSILGASMMFLSQTETNASMNYRVMSQSRYAAEAGIQKASNYLLDDTKYSIPAPGSPTDPISAYDQTKSPVFYNGAPVVLAAVAADSNYPVAAVKTAYENLFKTTAGELTAGTLPTVTLTYKASATLLSMMQFTSYGGTPSVIQTWQITGSGGLKNVSKSTVEVVAIVETPKVPATGYAAFATSTTCGALYFHGSGKIDSYDSREAPPCASGPAPGCSTENNGGDIGTNGNIHIQGNYDVMGNFYSPKAGVGTCDEANVTALTETGGATIGGDPPGSLVQLPKPIAYPLPVFSVTPPTTAVTIDSTLLSNPATACASLGLTLKVGPIGNCIVDPANNTLKVDGGGTDVTMPTVTVASGYKLVFVGHDPPNNVNINAILGSGQLQVEANMVSPLTNEQTVLKVAGKNADGTDMMTPFDLSAMSWKQNSTVKSYDGAALQIMYGGPSIIAMKGGNSQSAVSVYAPNAQFQLQGTQDLFGSILAKTVENLGNASIHYDRRLSALFWVVGQPMLGTFTWKRF